MEYAEKSGAPRNNDERKFDRLNNSKYRARFESFIEDEEVKDKSEDAFDVGHESF